MPDGATIRLIGNQTRRVACELVMKSPDGWVVTFNEERRTLEQSSKFYALCTRLAQSDLTWDGERQVKRSWHDLLIHAWMLATDRNPRLLPGLNGGRVSLLMSTRDMTKPEMSELIDFASAWCAMHSIDLGEE